jgi:hypothetical protein
MKIVSNIYVVVLLIFVVAGCSYNEPVPNAQPSAYWWKTVWAPDSVEIDFVHSHNIGKIYMRFFDVVPSKKSDIPEPIATLRVDAPAQNVKIVPVVYISEKCLSLNIAPMPKMLVYRVLQMCETNDITNVDEIQIDCDWKQSSQDKYFDFLAELGNILHSKGMKLSTTIRLHQLRMTPPPVDYGVLMLYNTRPFDYATRFLNPILRYDDVRPYLKDLKNYKLSLCGAYPNFSYQLVYRNEKLVSILYNENLADTSIYAKRNSEYEALHNRMIPNSIEPGTGITQILRGDHIVECRAEYEEIEKTMKSVVDMRPEMKMQSIIYDINSRNINNLTYTQYEKILSNN